MSETTLVLLITAAIILAMFAWVPLLHFFCPPCGRYLNRLRRRQVQGAEDEPQGSNVEAV
jgi:cytochrome c oxidase assembly protein Cox11